MKKNMRAIAILLFLSLSHLTYGQSNEEKALEKGMEALKLMDDGKFKESIELLEEAQKLDPDRFDYPYEIAYANYAQGDYKGAKKVLEKIKNHKNATEQLYQLLGNCHDILGDPEKALEVYDEGLKLFPNSGIIYLEKGNVYLVKKDYNNALMFYEKGIELDPMFPSNYYRAALLYCNSTEEIWGLIYGEIFMNLERNSKRTVEISKLLYDTYKSQITFSSDSSMTVSFCQQMTMDVSSISDPNNIKLPFCMIYEPTLLIAIAAEKSIDINALDRIRTSFVENYFKSDFDKTHPNILFSHQKKMEKAGHLEAYNHWILMKGDEDEFMNWHSKNSDKWDKFVKWFGENGLELNDKNKFYRDQY